jgi:hypothetical protein
MKQILIGRSIAYGAKVGGGTISGINEINVLDTGAFAVFTDNNVLVTTVNAATVLPNSKNIIIAVGNQLAGADSKTKITVPIPRVGTNYQPQAYVAPVKVVKFIGNDGTIGSLNLPTIVAKQEAFIKITDTTLGLRTLGTVYENEVKRYSITTVTGDTNITILTKLIAQINNDPDSIVVATAVGASVGINLTAKDFGTSFDIALSGILENSTIEEREGATPGASVALNVGRGTTSQIAALEDSYSVERGNTNRTHLPQFYYKNPSLVTAGANYDTNTITFRGSRNTSLGMQDTYLQEIVLALINGSAQATTIATIMAEVFGGAMSTSNVEPGN